jgi:hypothetical protein
MTIDEALNVLKQYIDYNNPDVPDFYTMEEACEVVIKALEQEPCGDAISREDALMALTGEYTDSPIEILSKAIKRINALPPVTPQYTEAEIQKMQDLEFAEIQKAYEIGKAENPNKWIPVSERLPEAWRYVNCTCHSLVDDREDWVIETCYVPQPKGSPYSDWGNMVMLNDGECEVVAWMYRDIPDPYKASPTGAESEG